jgi:hypothetical protein
MAYADRTKSDYDKLMKAKGDLVKPDGKAAKAGKKADKKTAKKAKKKRKA